MSDQLWKFGENIEIGSMWTVELNRGRWFCVALHSPTKKLPKVSSGRLQ